VLLDLRKLCDVPAGQSSGPPFRGLFICRRQSLQDHIFERNAFRIIFLQPYFRSVQVCKDLEVVGVTDRDISIDVNLNGHCFLILGFEEGRGLKLTPRRILNADRAHLDLFAIVFQHDPVVVAGLRMSNSAQEKVHAAIIAENAFRQHLVLCSPCAASASRLASRRVRYKRDG
jgi:hypothetical protein